MWMMGKIHQMQYILILWQNKKLLSNKAIDLQYHHTSTGINRNVEKCFMRSRHTQDRSVYQIGTADTCVMTHWGYHSHPQKRDAWLQAMWVYIFKLKCAIFHCFKYFILFRFNMHLSVLETCSESLKKRKKTTCFSQVPFVPQMKQKRTTYAH